MKKERFILSRTNSYALRYNSYMYLEAGLLLVDIARQLVDPGELGDVPVAALVAVHVGGYTR